MKYLLDTVTFLWAVYGDLERLGENAGLIIPDPENVLRFSAASTWEIVLKYGTKKLPLPLPPRHFIEKYGSRLNCVSLPVTQEHTFAVTDLPFHHKDPFDRLLIAQSRIENLPIITPDPVFHQYGIEVIW